MLHLYINLDAAHPSNGFLCLSESTMKPSLAGCATNIFWGFGLRMEALKPAGEIGGRTYRLLNRGSCNFYAGRNSYFWRGISPLNTVSCC